MNQTNPALVAGLSSLAALLLASMPASAASITWNTTSGTWDISATNWSGASGTPWDVTNGGTNTAIFTTGGTSTISGSVYVNGITFNPSLGNLTITGGTLNLAGTTPTISQFDSADTLTISSALLGSAGMIKAGVGTLVLSGSNALTGTTTIKGSSLVLDYSGLSNSAAPISSSATVTLDMGTLVIKGKTSGATTQTINTLNLGVNVGESNTLRLDSNGGSGIALTVSTLGLGAVSRNTNLIDVSSSASNSLTVNALSNGVVKNGILMFTADSGATSRANLIVHDSSGYGFATLSGVTSGTIGRLTAGTTLNATSSSNTTNYFLTTSGTLTRTADLSYNTITIDSSAGPITLNMGSNNLLSNNDGCGMLVSGANDVSILGTGRIEGVRGLWLHNYSSGTMTLGLGMSTVSSVSWYFGGTGLTVWTGIQSSQVCSLYIEGEIFRIAATQDVSTGGLSLGGIYISNGGVLEIAADLNGATSGDFSNSIGNSSNCVHLWGNSGVSAQGANRTVNFGGSGAVLTWGTNNFLTDASGTGDGNYTFLLSSDKSDATVTVQNKIALGSLQRTVQVSDGSAATDAVLSGTLSGVGGLTKTGLGTLALTASNTYTGATIISAGELDINGSLSASSAVSVGSGATLGGTGKVNGSVTGTNATISGNGLSMGATILDGSSRLAGTNTASSITVRSGTTTNQGTTTSTSSLSVKAGATLNNTGSATATMVTVENTASLKNNGSITASNVNVSGLLSGTGTITGALTIQSNGELAPGNSPGTTTVDGSLTVQTGAKVSMQMESLSSYDQIAVSGGVTLGGTLALDLSDLFLTQTSALTSGTSLTLINNTSTDSINTTFERITYATSSGTYTVIGNTFSIGSVTYGVSYSGGDGNDLALTVVPEPSTWAMLLGGVGLLVFGQRLRHGKNA